jgi:peptidoglycan hydrolase CwlO-like protein
MLDPNFDPYKELQEAKSVINTLVWAHNQHDEMMLDLTNQHRQLIDVLRSTKYQVELMRSELNDLRKQQSQD